MNVCCCCGNVCQDSRSSGVARICCEEGQRWKLCHGALTVDFRTGCSSCSMTNSFVTNAVLIERAVSCWHLHRLISQTTQYLDSWLSALEVDDSRRGPGEHVPQCPIGGDATVAKNGKCETCTAVSVAIVSGQTATFVAFICVDADGVRIAVAIVHSTLVHVCVTTHCHACTRFTLYFGIKIQGLFQDFPGP